jgi:hypothetical protein
MVTLFGDAQGGGAIIWRGSLPDGGLDPDLQLKKIQLFQRVIQNP